MDQNAYVALPGISPEELGFLQIATRELNGSQQTYFYTLYSGKRRNPKDVLVFCIIGLFLLPGLQRFMTGRIDWGIFYLLTWGLGFILSIVDVINHRDLALEYNKKMAYDCHRMAIMTN